METKEKDYRKLRFALALKTVMLGFNKSKTLEGLEENSKNISFRKLEANSGIPHPAIVQIIHGKKNASWTTIDAILEGLNISLSDFAAIYDEITEKQVIDYKQDIEKKKQERKRKIQKKTKSTVKNKK